MMPSVATNQMEVRAFRKQDHPLLISWWEGHKWPAIPMTALPTQGLIVYSNGQPVVAGFVYVTDSEVAIMEWLVSDPKSSPFTRSDALIILMEALCDLAKAGGAHFVFSFFKQPRLVARAESIGFKKTDTDMIHLLREI